MPLYSPPILIDTEVHLRDDGERLGRFVAIGEYGVVLILIDDGTIIKRDTSQCRFIAPSRDPYRDVPRMPIPAAVSYREPCSLCGGKGPHIGAGHPYTQRG